MIENDFNKSYIGTRKDILKLVPKNTARVLDIGCSTGNLGMQIKSEYDSKVFGVELDSEMAKVAKKRLDGVLNTNIEDLSFDENFFKEKFDLIIFGDVLEHLYNPWEVLKKSKSVLNKGGFVIVSIPNISHYSTFYNLYIKNRWPYKDRGIHDRTHLRFFTKKNLKDLINYAGMEIAYFKRKYRIIERPCVLNVLSNFFAIPPIRNLITHQFLVVAKAKK